MGHAHKAIVFLISICSFTSLLASTPTWVGVEIQSFSQANTDPEIIYSTDSNGLFRSTDRGESWTPVATPKLFFSPQVTVVPEDKNHLILWHQILSKDKTPTYLESKDSGLTWSARAMTDAFPPIAPPEKGHPHYGDFRIDTKEQGGTWWFVFANYLLRSIDAGQTWQVSARDSQNRLILLHIGDWVYRLSGDILFRSHDKGENWDIVQSNPLPNPGNGVNATDLFETSNGELFLRIKGKWFTGNHDNPFLTTTNRFDPLPDQSEAAQGKNTPSQWYCRIKQNPMVPDKFLAFCAWDNRSWPSRLCIWRTENAGITWEKPTDGTSKCHSDLPAWSPFAIWIDRNDPNLMLISWMAGGIYRSEDGGKTWRKSDKGLRFREAQSPRFEAIYEPPLIRAVIEDDYDEIERLLSEGADINTRGNRMSGVLEADLFTTQRYGPRKSLYHYLRARGALAPKQPSEDFHPLEFACTFDLNSVVEDLIDSGYNWGYDKEFDSCFSSASKMSLDVLVNRYIAAGKFPSADQIALALLKTNHDDLAVKLLEKSSKNKAFDRQSTPPSSQRSLIFYELWNANKRNLAEKYRRDLQVTDAEMAHTVSVECDITLTERYASLGFPVTYEPCLTLLSDPPISDRKKLKMLRLMRARGQLTDDVWVSILESTENQWMEKFHVYQKFAKEIAGAKERTQGIIGINYDLIWEKKLVVLGITPGFPAEQNGIKVRDEIISVNGTDVVPENIKTMALSIRGRPGTTVNLTISRSGERMEITLIRKRKPN